MILLVDLCYRPGSLSSAEFVLPVAEILRREGIPFLVRHRTEVAPGDLEASDGAILCGTAVMDAGYLDHPESFAWLPSFPRPVLGICAGMHAMARAYGGEVRPGVGIGMTGQEVVCPDPLLGSREEFPAYELHRFTVEPPPSFRVLARSRSGTTAIRHERRPVYGVLFHPEVRNRWFLHGFLELCPGRDNAGMGSSGPRER